MTVRLRPHHLLCMLTYAGKGYSAAFTANYDRVAGRLAAGEDILIVNGPDDICAPLLKEPGAHCFDASVTGRDRQAAQDIGLFVGADPAVGARLRLDKKMVTAMREAFSTGVTRKACSGCEWVELCNAIAAQGYETTRL